MTFITLLRTWRDIAIAALVLTVLGFWIALSGAEKKQIALQADLREARQMIDQERERIRTQTALAQAQDAARVAATERDQTKISEEISNDHADQLARLRSRYAALQLRNRTTEADRRSSSGEALPGVPNASFDFNDAAEEDGLSAPDALIASEQALKLKALQDWVREQVALDRDAGIGDQESISN